MKHQILSRLMSGKNIKEYFKGKIEKVVIEYTTTYSSFAGVLQSTNKLTKMSDSEADFFIICPNPECTVEYIDLRPAVDLLSARNEVSCTGETRCSGKTAPDHPNQDCDVKVEYTISLQYAQPDA